MVVGGLMHIFRCYELSDLGFVSWINILDAEALTQITESAKV